MHSHASDPQDAIFVVSFPKSGRTWLRVLLSRYKQHLLDIEAFELKLHAVYVQVPRRIPQYVFYHARSGDYNRVGLVNRLRGMLGLEIRAPFHFDLSFCEGSRVIFLVRDPRDTIVSYFHQLHSRDRVYRKDISAFLRDSFFGLNRILEFMNFLAQEKEKFPHLLIYYEDMHEATADSLKQMLQFAEIPLNGEWIEESVSYGCFSNMRKLEFSGAFGDKLTARDSDKANSYKVRKGRVGSYVEELNEEDTDWVESQIQSRLHPFFGRYQRPPVESEKSV
jgi:hypothetical protein